MVERALSIGENETHHSGEGRARRASLTLVEKSKRVFDKVETLVSYALTSQEPVQETFHFNITFQGT